MLCVELHFESAGQRPEHTARATCGNRFRAPLNGIGLKPTPAALCTFVRLRRLTTGRQRFARFIVRSRRSKTVRTVPAAALTTIAATLQPRCGEYPESAFDDVIPSFLQLIFHEYS